MIFSLHRNMNQPIVDPPPPPPDVPPPSQTRRSRRSMSDRSLNSNNVPTTSETTQTATTQQQQTIDCDADVSASARTVTHENTAHHNSNISGPATREEEKTAMHAMEMNDPLRIQVPDAPMSRFPRMLPWSKHPLDVGIDGIIGGISSDGSSVEGLYYGDVMSSFPLEDDSLKNNFSTDSTIGTSQSTRFQRFRWTVGESVRSSFSLKSSQSRREADGDDNESLSDFKDWTPPDSAYGAAFPVCGWVPKHYRRLIEASIIGLFFIVLVYFVVTTSIRLSLDQVSNHTSNSTSGKNNKNKVSDDDYYIDYDTYHYNNADDDEARVEGDDIEEGDDDAVYDQQQGDDDGERRLFLRLF